MRIWIELLLLACLSGCNGVWQEHVVSASPDGSARVHVLWARGLADVHLKIILSANRGVRTIFAPDGDRIPALTEVAWSADSRRVAILVCDQLKKKIVVGYDIDRGRANSSESTLQMIKEALAKRYKLDSSTLSKYEGDPIRWACGEDHNSGLGVFREVEARSHPVILKPLD